MIQAKELRIGNWVIHDNTLCRVWALKESKVWAEGEQYKCFNDDFTFRPIPLTPEILEKCGFESHKNSNEYWHHWVLPNGWHISVWIYDRPVAGFEITGTAYWGDQYTPVTSLHQLQNLYFALTGEELNYTP